MPFLFLLLLSLICFQNDWPLPWFGPDRLESVLWTWCGVALLPGVAGVIALRLSRGIYRDPSRRQLLMRRFSVSRRYFIYGLLVFYGIALYVFGWGWLGAAVDVPPIRKLVILAPFFSALFLSWACFYEVERAAHDTVKEEGDPPFPARWVYVGLQARHNLLLVFPPLLLILLQETILALLPDLERNALVIGALGVVLVAAAFLSIPWALRLILGLKPLPEGPLRTRLLDTARRLNFRCSDILVWNTRHTVANAMVTGPLPFLRYVILTDRLMAELESEEVEAVFGHEVGHIKHHHMLFYLGFFLISLLALGGAWDAILGEDEVRVFLNNQAPQALAWLAANSSLPLLAVLALYVFSLFGFLSRRCERQADIFGCRTVSCPVFISALEKVARLNGIHRERPGWLSSWQHSTISRRVAFLERLYADPSLEPRFQRRLFFVKWGVILGLTGLLLLLFQAFGGKCFQGLLR
jgi:Zn-dependent protease with chaperone function